MKWCKCTRIGAELPFELAGTGHEQLRIRECAMQGMSVKGTRAYVRSCVEGSLKRLGVQCIDLYYQHRVDREVPIEETWAELKVHCCCIA